MGVRVREHQEVASTTSELIQVWYGLVRAVVAFSIAACAVSDTVVDMFIHLHGCSELDTGDTGVTTDKARARLGRTF